MLQNEERSGRCLIALFMSTKVSKIVYGCILEVVLKWTTNLCIVGFVGSGVDANQQLFQSQLVLNVFG